MVCATAVLQAELDSAVKKDQRKGMNNEKGAEIDEVKTLTVEY